MSHFPQVHVGGSVAALGGRLYVSGGYDNTFELSDVVEVYDPSTRSWTPAGRLPQPTFWHGSVSIFRQFMPLVPSTFEPIDIPEANAIHLHRHHRNQALHNHNNNVHQNRNQDVNEVHWELLETWDERSFMWRCYSGFCTLWHVHLNWAAKVAGEWTINVCIISPSNPVLLTALIVACISNAECVYFEQRLEWSDSWNHVCRISMEIAWRSC